MTPDEIANEIRKRLRSHVRLPQAERDALIAEILSLPKALPAEVPIFAPVELPPEIDLE